MSELFPVILVGAIIGAFAIVFIIAYIALKKKTEELPDNERNMSDGELIKRLMDYAKPFWKQFLIVLLLMAFSICFDIVSPLIIGGLQDMVKGSFILADLYKTVAMYGCILIVSMICTYFQSIILQRVGQKILSDLRMDIFTHIEKLSHEQLNNIPVGIAVRNKFKTTIMQFFCNVIRNFINVYIAIRT